MNIEEIMKPYLDKKNRIEAVKKTNENYQEQIDFLNIRLNRLRENKSAEIEEYVNNALNSNQNFYVGYGAMLRKDLEQEYASKEQELQKQIETLKENIESNLNSLNNSGKYHNVDVREYVEFKQEARKKLFSAKKDLEFRLQEAELNYNVVMLNLSKFKLEYDEQHRVINGDAYKSIYAQADSLIDVKRNIQQELDLVNEYIEETELTKEEISVLMMSMTPWEKEEYDRRKSLNTMDMENDLNSAEVETIPEIEENEIIEEPFSQEEVVETEETKTDLEDDYIIDIPTAEDVSEESNKENDDLSEALDDLLSEIFKDIIKSNKEMGVIKSSDIERTDDTIELNNEFYCNSKDLLKATKNYYKKNKGNKFKVKGIEEDLSITRKGLRRLKKTAKKCSTLILLEDKKLGSTDIKRVYGKDTADKYDAELKEIGKITTESKEGNYVNFEEYKANLMHLFGVKRDSWLKRLVSKLRKSKEQDEVVENIDEQIYLEENVKTR